MVGLAWTYLLIGMGIFMPASDVRGLPSTAAAMTAMEPIAWTTGYAALMLVMWWLMMVAMMLPSATPMILLFAAISRKRTLQNVPQISTAGFVAGYLTVWGGFSVVAVAAQWVLDRVVLL